MTRSKNSRRPVVIVGAGHAGAQCATMLRRAGYEGPIRLLGAEEVLPYDRPPLSKAWLKGETTRERLTLRAPEFYAARDIEVTTSCRVAEIFPSEHRLRLADGALLDYRALVLAPGAAPRALPLAMIEAENDAARGRLLVLRDLADAERLKAVLAATPRLLVIGGGYIGLEVAASARALGCPVVVVEAAGMLMPRLGSPEVSRFFADRHEREGVEIRLATRLVRLHLGTKGVLARLEDGGTIAADFALVGIGAVPRSELARKAGIACEDGILVDARLRTDAPDVFAIGDAARIATPRYGSIRLECIQNANESAEIAARVIAGDADARYDPVPWFWTEQHGIRLQSVGLPVAATRRLLRGKLETGRFSVLHLDAHDRLVALDSVATTRDFVQAKKLIAARCTLDAAKAVDPEIPLKAALREE